ncbi:XRE family transcriptional regulator [Glaciihabitans tibetensis]|uniref:XRE family transcriptional regulator n=1 Tax=Glaciihabitans tibetensis TaxID=1266600 RepID=A0A2T0VJV6_9MICO|nr:helix-turn-helix domain-containing protein [Glaciihabitans tibetensis]PRY70511.1 XRE family transcriptional regulator [Glaciihabitans tibetensis]
MNQPGTDAVPAADRAASVSPQSPSGGDGGFDEQQLGTYIRELRVKRTMSLRTLAGLSDVSVSFLSQVERGTASPSIASLMRIAKSLDQTIGSLFEHPSTNSRLVRAGEGPRLVHPKRQWAEELLTPRDFSRLQVIRSTLAVKGTTGPEMLSYGGASESSIVVESGSLTFTLGAEEFLLAEGDCLSYDASMPHRITNAGATPCVMVFMSSPPIY